MVLTHFNAWSILALTMFCWESNAYSAGRVRQVQCPMDFDVPLPGGQPSPLHLKSVANFLEPRVQDSWWTEPRVLESYKASDDWAIGPSKIAGCGIIATRLIPAGEKIGTVWIKDPASFAAGEWGDLMPRHFTPWFGRAVNHCDHPNSRLAEDAKGTVSSVAIRDIEAGEEVTGNYNEAAQQFPHLVSPAPPEWTC
mmetsp:Transcript_69260/g.150738  ORF Transcript_69260/g.150738 Transcript_69260/m.150738 type:complete len:196 (-) Transcript_69260:150-737(-)